MPAALIPLASFQKWLEDWAPAAEWAVAGGTLLLAFVTAFLAWQTRSSVGVVRKESGLIEEQVRTQREALAATLRPILVDARPDSDPDTDRIDYPVGGQYLDIRRSNLVVDYRPDGLLCSVALRNVGPGVAIVQDDAQLHHPKRDTPYIGLPTRKVVPTGDLTRLTFTITGAIDSVAFEVEVPYTDADGKQRSTTRLRLDQGPRGWRVRQIFLSAEGRETVSSGGAG